MENELSSLLSQLQSLSERDILGRRIELCRAALALVDRQIRPEVWAGLQVKLANALSESPAGNRVDNQEEAIVRYLDAATVYTRDTHPEQWAIVQIKVGAVYDERIRGDRADNLERAIGCYQQALETFGRDRFTENWAAVQNNLGNAPSDCPFAHPYYWAAFTFSGT